VSATPGIAAPVLDTPQAFDCGEISLDGGSQEVRHQLIATNNGASTERIGKITTTCGCLVAASVGDAVEPNGQLAFDLSIAVSNVGRIQQSAIVLFESGRTTRLTLMATGIRSSQLLILPSRHRLKNSSEEVIISLHIVDRNGKLTEAPPKITLLGNEFRTAEFTGWTIVEQGDTTTGRPLRQVGDIKLQVSKAELQLPAKFTIDVGRGLSAEFVIDSAVTSD